ncbi:hypothetical protein NMG60_11015392 [Bertholletia excelsa]
MGSRFLSFSFLFCILLVSRSTHTTTAREIARKSLKDFDTVDPSLNVFFRVEDLKVGNKMLIFFTPNNPSESPKLLPREEADSIPFSSSHLPYLLNFFSFSKDSPQAKAMQHTLHECELEPINGEFKFCATSLESMLDSVQKIFGWKLQFRVITTNLPSNHTVLLQHYTILEVPEEISTPKMLACHSLPYPYAVFYCHGQRSKNRLFRISLGGENGKRVEALGVCHMDTSEWNPNHVSFRVLGTRPGMSPVCHFFPADNLVWVVTPNIV